MECKIFYSWQSDLPAQTNEQFIEEALKNVIQKIKDDSSLEVNPHLDRDIADVPGSPDVVATILTKIEQSDIIVCDISIINNTLPRNALKTKKFRLTSNPNVLVEFGYALKSQGTDKIILVNNLAFGKHEDLPFDFRHKHVEGYTLSENSSNEQRNVELQSLEAQLERKIRQIILTIKKEPSQKPTPFDQAIVAIKNSQPNQTALISDFIDWAMKELEESSPPFPKVEGNALDILLASIDRTVNIIADFTRLFSSLVNLDSAKFTWLYKTIFERIIVKYNFPVGFDQSFSNVRMRFYQFIGHELFVSLIALLIDGDKLEIVADIFDEILYLENDPYSGHRNVSYSYISMLGESTEKTSQQTIEAMAEKLNQRHNEGELAKLTPVIKFIETDYFLSLRKGIRWNAVLDRRLLQPPKFLVKAYSRKYALKLLKPLAINNIDEIRSLLSLQSDKGFLLRWRFNFDVNKIGTE